MMVNMGVKYAGRGAFLWGQEYLLPRMIPAIQEIANRVHDSDPNIVLEAAIFEIITQTGIEQLEIPSYVLEEFRQPSTPGRLFNYTQMLFPDGFGVNQWGEGRSVPDLTQIETRMWFFYAGSQYIFAGVEALHLGQVMLMAKEDKGMAMTFDLLSRLRSFAQTRARRGFVLCNAHAYRGFWVYHGNSDNLLFDFHAFPSRPRPNISQPQICSLEVGFEDAIYGLSAGGMTAAGWRTASLPYLVELDNYDCTNHPGTQDPGDLFHPFGWDEISWFAHQTPKYQSSWLIQAVAWLTHTDPSGYFEMPGIRPLCDNIFKNHSSIDYYYASKAAGQGGFAQEDTIRQIWAGGAFDNL
jgi:hypothetical protein